MFSIYVTRQQWVYHIHCQVLAIESSIHLLLRVNYLIDASIKAIGIRKNWNECLIVNGTVGVYREIRQWIKLIQKAL
jgi:hypothetical protein